MILAQISPGEAVFVGEQLKGLGLPGAIIIVLMAVVTVMGTAIGFMWKHSNKVYGYRLAERDVLNKALTDASAVLAGLLKASEERNDLTEELASLIEKQGAAFELLKVTVLAQYDTIKSNQAVAAQAVASLADAVRQLTSMVQENRNQYVAAIDGIRNGFIAAANDIRESNRSTLQSAIVEMRGLLGSVTIIGRRKSPS
jgi:hypothetical protein